MKIKKLIILICSILVIVGVLIKDPQTITFENVSWEFTTEKPDINESDILMCVPAAFTTESGEVVGHYKGDKRREGKSDYRYTTVYLDRGHFQQLSLVRNGKPKKVTDDKRRFRRALCKIGDKFFIENSKYPITLTTFASQLSAKYDYAWNLDMGTYSYGWYKDNRGTHRIGIFSYLNSWRQSNWIIVRKK